MKLGIVGLPNVGKSTLFNSLTKAGAESANYPFCTIDPNVGIVPVPDKRLQQLGDFYQSKKVTPAVIEFVDIAGLVKGASKGEGLGNQFLANIREVDAIVHVVRCFEDPNVIHVDGSIDPLRDIETIDLELIFADLEVLERRISKTAKSARMDKEAAKELEFQERLKKLLEDGKDAILMELQNEDEEKWIAEYNLLTSKPVIYAANVAEDDLADDGANNSYVQSVREYAKEHNSEVFVICAEIEAEISELEEDEKKMFLEDLGLTESGLEKLIAASYRLLGLMSFLTAGEMRPVHGPSKSEQKHRRQPEKSTPISSADSSKPRLSIIRICSTAVPTQEQERKALCVWKEKITLSATAMSSCSVSTFDK